MSHERLFDLGCTSILDSNLHPGDAFVSIEPGLGLFDWTFLFEGIMLLSIPYYRCLNCLVSSGSLPPGICVVLLMFCSRIDVSDSLGLSQPLQVAPLFTCYRTQYNKDLIAVVSTINQPPLEESPPWIESINQRTSINSKTLLLFLLD